MKKKTLKVVNSEYIPNLENKWEDPKHWYSKIKKPTALSWGKWDKWKFEMQSKYPIRYFIQETLPELFDIYIKTKIKNIKWYIFYRIHPKHQYHIVRTGLKQGYYDPDTLMLHSSFQLLADFVKFNVEQNLIDWDSDENGQFVWHEMKLLKNWWCIDRPERENRFNMKHRWPDIDSMAFFDDDKREDSDIIEYRRILDLYSKAKEEWDQEDEEMFIRLIKIRRYLWYL